MYPQVFSLASVSGRWYGVNVSCFYMNGEMQGANPSVCVLVNAFNLHNDQRTQIKMRSNFTPIKLAHIWKQDYHTQK